MNRRLSNPIVPHGLRRVLARGWALLLVVALLVLVGGGIAAAQSSFAFDLACRGVLTSGGGVNVYPSNNARMVGALGQSLAGSSQGPTVGVHGGYLHSVQPAMTTLTAAPATAPEQLNNTLSLPFISSFIRVIRGGC